MPREYYRIQQKKHTGELKYIAYSLLAIILFLTFGIIGQCCFKDEAIRESQLTALTHEQRVEVMSRQGGN